MHHRTIDERGDHHTYGDKSHSIGLLSPVQLYSLNMLHIYALATLLPLVILLFRRSIYALLTPRGYAGIPAYNDSKPIWGDLHRLKEAAQTGKGVSTAFDNALQDLGPISQLRIGFFKT